MILETKRDSTKQVHHVGFMVMDEDVDAIINLWLEEWHEPLVEPLPEREDEEDPPVHQVHGEGNEGGNGQGNQSENEEEQDDDDRHSSDQSDSQHTPSPEHVYTQTQTRKHEGHPHRKKEKYQKPSNVNTLTEDDVEELTTAMPKVKQDNLSSLKT